MKALLSLSAVVLAMFSFALVAQEKAEKNVVLEGKLACTKCELKETKACRHVLLVKDEKAEKKELKYYLIDKGAKEPYHGEVCSEPKAAKVSGKLVEKKEKDETKLTIEEAKVEFKK